MTLESPFVGVFIGWVLGIAVLRNLIGEIQFVKMLGIQGCMRVFVARTLNLSLAYQKVAPMALIRMLSFIA